MSLPPSKPFQPALPLAQARTLPPATVLAGSLLAAWPMVAHAPVLPPFGLLMLLAWRLLAPASLRVWAPAPLGFADDLISGQPLGSATLLWTLTFLAIEAVERRFLHRSFLHDWAVAAVAVAGVLVAGRYIATPPSARVDAMLWVQVMASVLFFPAAAYLCAWIDRKRGHR